VSHGEVLLELVDLEKSYFLGAEEIPVLKKINLVIRRGEFIAIMGTSGSGKSTLMNILGFLDRPTRGLYKLKGKDVTDLTDEDEAMIRNREIGFIFQTFNLLAQYSVFDNVGLPLMYRDDEVDEAAVLKAIDIVGLGHRHHHKPMEISGGQRQRVAIARALVTEPTILLADEPTGNLDSRTSVEIMTLFTELHKRGSTIILVTHEPDIAAFSERIIFIKDGVVQEDAASSQSTTQKGHAGLGVKKGLVAPHAPGSAPTDSSPSDLLKPPAPPGAPADSAGGDLLRPPAPPSIDEKLQIARVKHGVPSTPGAPGKKHGQHKKKSH
jgi:putative ABC transport system ATP-binding protein